MKPALYFYSHFSSYTVLLLAGFLFGWVLARVRASKYGLERRHVDNISLILPLAGLFGARLFARLFYAKLPLLEALKVWEGDGLVFYGGFVCSIGAVVAYSWAKGVPLIKLMDCLAPSAALGLAFGRVGCFLAGCCWGDVCARPEQLAVITDQTVVQRVYTVPAISGERMMFAVQFPKKSDVYKQHAQLGLLDGSEERSVPVHPVQLYEAGLAMLLAMVLHWKSARMRRGGSVALGLLIGYAMIRFGTEYLRADNKVYAWGFTFSQVVSIYILAGSAIVMAARWRWLKGAPDEASERREPAEAAIMAR